ncbi:MAG TPA: ATP-binding protein [Labilithrix sp.]|nr:ATP-binding protein [Labilithrix sp.]
MRAGEFSSVALAGLSASLVRISATIARGADHSLRITGLREADIDTTRRRVVGALDPIRRYESYGTSIAIDVSPAGTPNDGALDLALAMAFLLTLEQVSLPSMVAIGELSTSGELRHVRGVLPALRGAAVHGIQHAIVPRANAPEAAQAGLEVRVVDHLRDVHAFVRGARRLDRARPSRLKRSEDERDLAEKPWFSAPVRRALEIAAAGQHPILLIGGSGRTALALRLPALLPSMTTAEAIEATSIHSVAGQLDAEQGLLTGRPHRLPHHLSVTTDKLFGDPVRPGEVSLAHGGVLLLDDLLAFRRSDLATLAAVLAKGESFGFPARPLLVGASRACPCGFRGDPARSCRCTSARIERHDRRLRSLFDLLFQMQVVMPPVFDKAEPERSEAVRRRVTAARIVQATRSRESEARRASANDWSKVLRVARTIADLDACNSVRERHVDEASKFMP